MGAGAASSLLVIAATAALASVLVAVAGTRRTPPPVVVLELLLGIVVGPAGPRAGPRRPDHRAVLGPGPRDAVLLRGLRDRPPAHPRPAGAAGGRGLAAVDRPGLRDRRRARGLGARRVVPLRGLGAGLDRARPPAADPARRRGAADAVRHPGARGRDGRRGRADPPHHARALHDAPGARGASCSSPSCCWRWPPGVLAVRSAESGWPLVQRGAGDERAAGRAHHRRARLRPRRARRGARPRHPPGRAGGGAHHPGRAAGPRDRRARVQARRGRLRLPHPVLLRGQRDALRPRRPDVASRRRPCGCRSSSRSSSSSAASRRSCSTAGVLDGRDRLALACLSATTLPIVVGITTLAVRDGHMRSANAAALVGAAILSALLFPLAGLRLRLGRAAPVPADAGATGAGGRRARRAGASRPAAGTACPRSGPTCGR